MVISKRERRPPSLLPPPSKGGFVGGGKRFVLRSCCGASSLLSAAVLSAAGAAVPSHTVTPGSGAAHSRRCTVTTAPLPHLSSFEFCFELDFFLVQDQGGHFCMENRSVELALCSGLSQRGAASGDRAGCLALHHGLCFMLEWV